MTVYVSNYLENHGYLTEDPRKGDEFKSPCFMTEQVIRCKIWEMETQLSIMKASLMKYEPNFYVDPASELLHFEEMFASWEDMDAINDGIHDLIISAYKSYLKEWRKFEKQQEERAADTKRSAT